MGPDFLTGVSLAANQEIGVPGIGSTWSPTASRSRVDG